MANQTLGGTSLLPLLEKGIPKLQKLREEYKGIHGLMNKSGVDLATLNAEKYLESTARLRVSLEELQTVAGAQLLPGFSDMLERLTKWMAQNSNTIGEFFSKVGKQLPTELERLTQALKPISEAVLFLSKHVGILSLAVNVLAGSVLVNLLKSLFSGFKAISSIFKGATSLLRLAPFLATPLGAGVGLGALGVGLAGTGAYYGYKYLTGESDPKDLALLKEVTKTKAASGVKADQTPKGEITLRFLDAPGRLEVAQTQGDYLANLGSLQVGQ
jgi:hypothetical protein